MERLKRICRILLFPHWAVTAVISAGSAAGLAWVFLAGREAHFLAYPIYVLAFYALTVVCIRLVPFVIRKLKEPRQEKTREELDRKFHRSMLLGAGMNLTYAVFQLGLGLLTESGWMESQGIYQLVMALMHIVLLGYEKKAEGTEGEARKQAVCWQGFRDCGIWLLFLHLTMTGLVFQMVWRSETKSNGEIMVIAVAAYTFYKLTMAVIHVVQYRKNPTPLWGAARNLDLSEAMMNLFALQASLLGVFAGAEQEEFRFLMNSISGAVVCLMTVTGAVGMIIHGNKKKQEVREKNEDGT